MSQNKNKLTESHQDFEEFTVQENGDEVIVLSDSNDKVSEESVPYNYVYANSILNGKLDGPPSNSVPRYQYIDTTANNTAHSSVESIVVSSPSSLQKPATVRQATVIGSEWKEEEIKLISKRFKEFSPIIGKDKKLKNKREMWIAIADEINSTFNTRKSPTQCMNKFYHNLQALKNPKKQVAAINNYKEEMECYESIQENLIQDYETNKNYGEILIPKTMILLAKINAEAQERRHREYMKAVRGLEERYMQFIAEASAKILT